MRRLPPSCVPLSLVRSRLGLWEYSYIFCNPQRVRLAPAAYMTYASLFFADQSLNISCLPGFKSWLPRPSLLQEHVGSITLLKASHLPDIPLHANSFSQSIFTSFCLMLSKIAMLQFRALTYGPVLLFSVTILKQNS